MYMYTYKLHKTIHNISIYLHITALHPVVFSKCLKILIVEVVEKVKALEYPDIPLSDYLRI